MGKLTLAYLIIVLFSHSIFCQKKIEKDSSSFYAKVVNGCLDTNFRADYFLEDPNLKSFFRQIDSTGFYESLKHDTIGELISLLKIAENDSSYVCLLPMYRILDSNADSVYRRNCKTSSRVYPYTNYCSEMPIKYAMLFYLQFVIVNPIKVSAEEVITNARLCKKVGSKICYTLTNEDYNNIYQKYYSWLDKGSDYQSFYKNPLMGSSYSWELEIELKGTGWYRKGNNYTPIKID
jgi:hypothetical protein